jgi:hypothetical protein
VWLPFAENDVTLRLDEMTGRVQGRFPPGVFTVGGGAFWVGGREPSVANWVDGTVLWGGQPLSEGGLAEIISRIDLTTGVVRTIDVGGIPVGLAFAAGDVWVAVDA